MNAGVSQPGLLPRGARPLRRRAAAGGGRRPRALVRRLPLGDFTKIKKRSSPAPATRSGGRVAVEWPHPPTPTSAPSPTALTHGPHPRPSPTARTHGPRCDHQERGAAGRAAERHAG
eukprot:scaffold110295_cov48-Phaeocystis_antarctica.AAC.1